MSSRINSRIGSRAGIRKVINVVDDKMLIFDPPDTNPMARMQRAAFPASTTTRIREHRFVFDRLFDDSASQEEVYSNTTRPLLDSVLDGYNATVFAYGATGCGKTHTISGTPQAPGIIFLTMKELFDRISEIRDTKLVEVSLSYLEIYNETIRDLLEPSNKQLVLREDVDHRISVSNLSTHKPENVEAVMDMILQGNQNRTISPTEANATSSRSHAVLQINVVQKGRTASISEAHTFATLSIIDLAGSERASATKNRGDRLLEGANINKSLLALGNCINALCDPRRRNHVPYRDSKLTRLLKFSLGGNCKTVMIVCVSPSSKHYDETLNTLKYADRAKKIKTKVIRNEHNLDRHVGSYLKMITEQKAEIEELRRRESKAVGTAMAHAEKARKKCLRALDDAMESLRTTYNKTAKAQERTCKTLTQLRNIINQINQVECLLKSYEKVVSSSPPHTDTIPTFAAFSEGMKQALQKLAGEKNVLERYCTSVTQDKQMMDTAMTTLTRRLEDTPGWTDADRVSFRAQAEALRLRSEIKILEQVAGEPIPTKIIEDFSSLFFSVVAKVRMLGTTDSATLTEEVTRATEDIMRLCHTKFAEMLADYDISTTSLNNKMGLSSILATAIKRPASVTSLSRDLPIPASPGKSLGKRVLSNPLNSSASVAAGAARRVSSIGSVRSLRRQLPGSAKKQVVVKSPMRNHRKAVKRVRWEDDGEICLDPPTPSRTPRSIQNSRDLANDASDLENDSLSPPKRTTISTDSNTNHDMSRVLNQAKSNTKPSSPHEPSFSFAKEVSSTPREQTTPLNSPFATSNTKFGVKGELRRKSGSSRSSLALGSGTFSERLSPPDSVSTIETTKTPRSKAGKENSRPASPEKGLGAGRTSVGTPVSSSARDSIAAVNLKAPSPVANMRSSPLGSGGGSSRGAVLGAPARISVPTASSANKHISQR